MEAEKADAAEATATTRRTSTSTSSSTHAPSPLVAGSAVVLLSNWEGFGLCERSHLHFDWIDALLPASQAPPASSSSSSSSKKAAPRNDFSAAGVPASAPPAAPASTFCGVSAILECVPRDSKVRPDQRRRLKNDVRQFNARAHRARWGDQDRAETPCCHAPAPHSLPLRLAFGTPLVYGYETTRIAFVVDASPTLTATYGFGDTHHNESQDVCCPLDRLVPMARTFFAALAQPVRVQVPIPTRQQDRGGGVFNNTRNVWVPDVAVTVLAVFPRASFTSRGSVNNNNSDDGSNSLLLVRDYRIRDASSASQLVRKMEEWVAGPLEGEIAARLAHPAASLMPQHTSYLRDLLDAGDVVLSTLSSAARPVIVLATDARSLSVDSLMVDVATDPDRSDVPLVVLDVSSPDSHYENYGAKHRPTSPALDVGAGPSGKSFHMLSYDPKGPAFPLFLSDDTEALYGICKATGGAFYDAALLDEAATTLTGKVSAESRLFVDHLFSSKRHSLRANAVQWYTLFSMSPLSPVAHPQVGRLAPPDFFRRRKPKRETDAQEPTFSAQGRPASGPVASGVEPSGGDVMSPAKKTQSRFAMYIVNPIRIKGLISLRLKEGGRVRAYGSSTNDPDKVSIQFVLPLDLGNSLHYELSYKALPGHGNFVGFANIKIDLAGEYQFIQSVKKEYLLPTSSTAPRHRPLSESRSVALALIEFLRWMRAEDQLESYLSPLKWSDQLASSDTPFLKRIGTLSDAQRRRHFRRDSFDCVCQGQMPYERDDGLLAEFRRDDNGGEALIDAVKSWSTQVILSRVLFLSSVQGAGANYCVVGLVPHRIASRLITVTVDSCGDISPSDRIEIVDSLRRSIDLLSDVGVLAKQLGPSIVVSKGFDSNLKQWFLKSQQRHSSWNLVKDPELLPLLVRRRIEFGGFLLLDSSNKHALLAKLRSRRKADGIATSEDEDPGVLFQYLLTINEDGVAVDLHMENEGGDFANLWNASCVSGTSMFEEMVRSLTKRDQDCAQALQSRTRLRRVFEGDVSDYEVAVCAKRLLAYASQSTQHLRFFRYGCGTANDTLRELTTATLISNSFGARVAPLPTSYDFPSNANAGSDWFVVEFDGETMTIVCLSSTDKVVSAEFGPSVFRTLDFFTFTTGDLYNRKADAVTGEDDESDDGHISEYLCVSEFSDFLMDAHAMNFSSAAYIALASNEHQTSSSPRMHSQDFEAVLAPLEFVEVVSVVIPGGNDDEGSSLSKFATMIGSLLFPISDEIVDCYYYRGGASSTRRNPCSDDDVESTSEQSNDASHDEVSGTNETNQSGSHDQRCSGNDFPSALPRNEVAATRAAAPLFVKLLLDGKPTVHHDLTCIKQSVSVSVLLSVFRVAIQGRTTDITLPLSHESAKSEILSLLNAFIFEQTLERLRAYGPNIQSGDLRLAKSCLRNARDVATSTMDAVFYSARVDGMIAAAPAGYDSDVDVGFRTLVARLLNHSDVQFREFGDGLVVVDAESGSSRLQYWSFVTVNLSLGTITTEVFHPDGFDQASRVLLTLQDLVAASCHKVNQQLLLQRLHKRRLASSLLIARDDEPLDHEMPDFEGGSFASGFFSCPIVFRTSFDLFHRCAANPSQVARTVEATVLHVFGISNRRQMFVYKDEDGSVFYMQLLAEGGGMEADGSIELVVHGIATPGPSVTKQLTAIIQKRLLQIGVDMLSSVLTKNPSYTWKAPDVAFIRAYEAYWESLETTDTERRWDRDRVYEFPDENLFDPGMILLCLRQNLCGSGYFHKLNLGEAPVEKELEDDSILLSDLGLIFYYNDAPSKLDPKLQHISTLTSKGAQYAREAGSGMAIIELELLRSTGIPIDRLTIGTSSVKSMKTMSPESVCFRRVEDSKPTGCCMKVTVTGTALDANVLHEWVLLSLNQTLLSWAIERQLETIQRRVFSERNENPVKEGGKEQDELVDQLAPGLSYFTSLLNASHALPHPSVLKCDLDGVIRSSTVASVAYELLERTIESQPHGLTIVRLSRGEVPCKVELRWEAQRRSVAVFDAISSPHDSRIIVDAPIDCPEYRCFFFTPDYSDLDGKSDTGPPKLFESITLTDGTGADPIPALLEVKGRFPALFRRSSAFVFSIKRNRRVLLAYNWTPQYFKQVVARLRERNAISLAATNQSINGLQRRCLRELSPIPVSARPFARKPSRGMLQKGLADSKVQGTAAVTTTESTSNEASAVSAAADSSSSDDPRSKGKRAVRPLAIRRPILVGKSVEGAAAHAVAASRARASANMFRPGAPTGPSASNRRSASGDPPSGSSVRQVKLPPERVKSNLSSVSEPGEDEEVKKLKLEYLASVYPGTGNTLRPHSLLQMFVLSMGSSFLTSDQPVPRSAASVKFLLSQSFSAWNDLVEIPRLPSALLVSFLTTFAHALTKCLPNLTVLPFAKTLGSESSHVIIVGETRAVRNCKCLAVVSLELIERRDRLCVQGDSWVVALPRHANRSTRKRKWPRYNDHSLLEKDSAGLDVLAFDSRVALSFRRLVFDFVSALAERDATTCGKANYSMELVRGMLSYYDLPAQIKTLQSNYNTYESQIVLRSYRDPLIARFEARDLFQWLQSNATGQGLVPCGSHGICFQRKVQCRDTTSTIFLRFDEEVTDRFVLAVLCRTQGRDLREFMFPNGAVVGVPVMDYIAIEAAGTIYERLKAAATHLHLSELWERASSSSSSASPRRGVVAARSPGGVTGGEIRTLLRRCAVTPLADVMRDPVDVERWRALVEGNATDWRRCSQAMAVDPAFSPWYPVALDDGGGAADGAALFYLRGEDVFLLVRTFSGNGMGHKLDVSVVQPPRTDHESDALLLLAQKLFNYFLHFLWSDLM